MSKVADTFRQPLVLIQTPECYSLCYWVDKGWKKVKKQTVEPPLTAISPQQPLFFVPLDSPYINSCLNLSTMATATKAIPNFQNNLLTTGSFFSD